MGCVIVNVLILDDAAAMVSFALRCNKAGHYTRVCVGRDHETHLRCKVGDGLVEKIENEEWQKHMRWADLVITSHNVRWLRELDRFKKQGYPVLSPSYDSAQLELVRSKGQEVLKEVGCNVIPYDQFSDYRKAEKFVLSTNERYVSKPDGDKDRGLTYVAKSPADMIYMLRRWSKTSKAVGSFMLQEYVEGTEFSVAGWMGKEGFSSYFEECFEFKKLMNEDYGPNTGEMGSAIKYTNNSQLAKEVLLPLEGPLMKMGHTGSVCVGVMVDEDGDPRPLEFTARLGWPSFNIVQQLHPEPCEWMADLLDGNDTFKPSDDHAVGIVMAMPDFPYSKLTKKEVSGVPIYGLEDDNPYREYLAPCEVMWGEAPAMEDDSVVEKKLIVSCGDYLCVATGCGDSVREAQKEAYKAVNSLEIPNNLIIRTDIGDMQKELEILQDQGFAQDWRW